MDSHHRTQLELTTTAHPGESLLEYLSFHEWSQRELARRTGLTPKTVSEICNGKAPISPKTALALEKVFGRPAHFWLNLQRNFSEAMARRRELSRAFDWNQWAQSFPIKEMKAPKILVACRRFRGRRTIGIFCRCITRKLAIHLDLMQRCIQANQEIPYERRVYLGMGT